MGPAQCTALLVSLGSALSILGDSDEAIKLMCLRDSDEAIKLMCLRDSDESKSGQINSAELALPNRKSPINLE